MATRIVWFEIGVQDTQEAKQFYEKMFDTELPPMEGFPDYHFFMSGDQQIGGLNRSKGKPFVTVYFAVDDVSDALKRAESLGGKVLVPESPLPNGETFGFVADPEGNIIGLWGSKRRE